ncbi:MAG: TlpA disulfide reductase family protein [Haloarculaceae archaeon]
MQHYSRRSVLGSAAAASLALAGCSSSPDPNGDGKGSSATSGNDDGISTSPDGNGSRAGNSDTLRLDTLAVGGSPGGNIGLDPPGSPVLLDFFATWCAPCKPQMDHLRTIEGEFDDLRLRSVTRETDREAIASFWRDYEGSWPVAMDPELLAFETYGVTRVPVLVVLDAEGAEVWRHAGLASADSIRSAVREARE